MESPQDVGPHHEPSDPRRGTSGPDNSTRSTSSSASHGPSRPGLHALFREELKHLGHETAYVEASENSPAWQPHIRRTTANLCGLALSGGGIRSATFNLGLLQAIQRQGLLRHVDYISAVSGGAYIAGWHACATSREPTPEPSDGAAERTSHRRTDHLRDTARNVHVRHLREFSKFLLPRVGATEGETWLFAFLALVSAIPTLLVAQLLLLLGYSLWFAVALFPMLPLSSADPICFAITALSLLFIGGTYAKLKTHPWPARLALIVHALVVASLATVVYAYLETRWLQPLYPRGSMRLSELLSEEQNAGRFFFIVAHVPLSWLTTSVGYGAILALTSRLRGKPRTDEIPAGGFGFWAYLHPKRLRADKDRITSRLIPLSLVWLLLATAWLPTYTTWNRPFILGVAASVLPAYLALLFWAWGQTTDPIHHVLLRRPREVLRRLLPQVLVYAMFAQGICITAAILSKAMQVAAAIDPERSIESGLYDPLALWCVPIATVLLLTLAAFCIEPHAISLHQWYRTRIARAFLAKPLTSRLDMDRRTDEQEGDDPLLRTLEKAGRPILLIGCTANDQRGDPLRTLGRGGQNSTLSHIGLFTGDTWSRLSALYKTNNHLTLGDALAASGAAFNSSMGEASTKLGPLVSFLMAAFNLRLGLWVTRQGVHRGETGGWEWPGWLLVRELLGSTSCRPSERNIHLSDGGHFDNTGIYELVRRHCRYVIASDCGQDSGYFFDDVANAIRKTRQDFGIDIEIDTSGLTANSDRISEQCVAIGTIHYGPRDKGLLLLLKPTLTGREPPDVRQYAKRNDRFPHEPTGDQFYDHAQWEAYRRLGLHVGTTVFAPMQDLDHSDTDYVDRVMNTVAREWRPTPPELRNQFLVLTERLHTFESNVLSRAPEWLLRQVYADIGHAVTGNPAFPKAKPVPADRSDADNTTGTDDAATSESVEKDDVARAITVVVSLIQVMEDVWHGAALEHALEHPLATGWMTYFHRWSSTPFFRWAWPLLSPMYSLGFRRFAERQFGLPKLAGQLSLDQVELDRFETSYIQRTIGGAIRPTDHDQLLFLGVIRYENAELEVAKCVVELVDEGPIRIACWQSSDCVVLPFLTGANCGTTFVDKMIGRLRALGVNICEVDVREPETVPEGKPRAGTDLVKFYRAQGFGPREGPSASRAREQLMVLHLAPDSVREGEDAQPTDPS